MAAMTQAQSISPSTATEADFRIGDTEQRTDSSRRDLKPKSRMDELASEPEAKNSKLGEGTALVDFKVSQLENKIELLGRVNFDALTSRLTYIAGMGLQQRKSAATLASGDLPQQVDKAIGDLGELIASHPSEGSVREMTEAREALYGLRSSLATLKNTFESLQADSAGPNYMSASDAQMAIDNNILSRAESGTKTGQALGKNNPVGDRLGFLLSKAMSSYYSYQASLMGPKPEEIAREIREQVDLMLRDVQESLKRLSSVDLVNRGVAEKLRVQLLETQLIQAKAHEAEMQRRLRHEKQNPDGR